MAKAKNKTEKEQKEKKTSPEDLISSICKKVAGAELLDRQTVLEQGFISTCNLALNYICSGRFVDGGIPKGRVTEIFGPSSSAKTVIANHILQGCQKLNGISVLLDSESAYSPTFSEALGLDSSRLVYLQPDHLEGCFQKTEEIALMVSQKGGKDPVCVVYDSIAASPSEKEYNEMMEGKSSGPEMGHRARICSQELRKIASFLNKQNCAMVIINQIRMKIGVMYGNPETTAGGGNSLEYYCSIRLDCRRRKVLEDSRKRAIGIKLDVKCVKNKVDQPYRVARNLRLYWNQGIDPCSGLLDLLIDADKIENSSPGWYNIVGNPEAKFQAKKEENYVPAEFLLAHPEVVDSTSEELSKFLGYNAQAIQATRLEGAGSQKGINPETGEIEDPELTEELLNGEEVSTPEEVDDGAF